MHTACRLSPEHTQEHKGRSSAAAHRQPPAPIGHALWPALVKACQTISA